MESKLLEFEKALQDIGQQTTLTCRLALMKGGDRNIVLNAIADVSTCDEDLSWTVYDYGEVIFIQVKIAGEQLGSWLRTGNGSAAAYDFFFPKLQQSVSVSRWPSHVLRASIYCLPNPHTLYQVRSLEGKPELSSRCAPLVRNKCPLFPDYSTAAFRLLLNLERLPGGELPDDTVVVRMADSAAWIESVVLAPRSISVDVQGSNVHGTRLTIGGAQYLRVDQRLQEAGPITLDIAGGLPERIWMILSRDDSWLDTRDLEPRRGSSGIRWNNVVMKPGSLCEQVMELIHGGECTTVEFKEQLPQKDERFLKTVAAFANGQGGVILLGVVNGTGEIRSITDDITAYKDRITNIIRNGVVPKPEVQIEPCHVGSQQVVAVVVQEGSEPPYAVSRNGLTYYVRRNANTFEATPQEIRAMSIKNYPVENRDDFSFYSRI